MSEDIAKLIEDMCSGDALIRSFAANIFMNLRDPAQMPELFDRVRGSDEFIKSMFIKLMTLHKKEHSKSFLLKMLADRVPSVRRESAAAILKIAKIFGAADLKRMLASQSDQENALAVEILCDRPPAGFGDEIYSRFLKYPSSEERMATLERTLKFAVRHGRDDQAVRAGVAAIMEHAFKNRDMRVFELATKWAHVLIDPAKLVSMYSSFMMKDPAIDGMVVRSLVKVAPSASSALLEKLAADDRVAEDLRQICFKAFIESRSAGCLERGIDLYCGNISEAMKYIGLTTILNARREKLEPALKKNIMATTREPRAHFENLVLLDYVVQRSSDNLRFLLSEYDKNISPDTRGAILATIYKKGMALPDHFREKLESNFQMEVSKPLRYFMITALAKTGDGPALARLFEKCRANAEDLVPFAEAFAKRCAVSNYDTGLYSRFIDAVVKSGDLNLIALAASCVPKREGPKRLHCFVEPLSNARIPMFGAMLKNYIVRALLSSPDDISSFLDGTAYDLAQTYIPLLAETGHMNAITAYSQRYFTEGGELDAPAGGPVAFMLKDAMYSVVKRNLDHVFSLCDMPLFQKPGFSNFMSPIIMNTLDDALVRDDTPFEDISFLYKKTSRSVEFFRVLVKTLGDGRFFLYNILQKRGGAAAMELISALGS